MANNLKLMCVLAHPDDESLGTGGILAKYAAEGVETYQSVFGEVIMHIAGMERRGVVWPEWAITTRIATGEYRQKVWEAILCHESQLVVYRQLEHLSQDYQKELWDSQAYYRAFSLINGGRRVEQDLFEGLR